MPISTVGTVPSKFGAYPKLDEYCQAVTTKIISRVVLAPILSACVVEEPKRMLHGELAKTDLSGCAGGADDLHRL
jgi:hypothetical protein